MTIRLSPKHGVNPSLGICFWCGGDDGTVVLLGKIISTGYTDPKAPHRAVYSYEPCDTCKEQMARGVTIVEVTMTEPIPPIPPIQTNPQTLYPTGRWSVITEGAVKRWFSDPILSSILARRQAFMSVEMYEDLGFPDFAQDR